MSTMVILQDILVEEFKLRREQLGPDAKLSELGVDSLAVLEIMFKIEDRFGLNIKDDVPELSTVNDVVVHRHASGAPFGTSPRESRRAEDGAVTCTG